MIPRRQRSVWIDLRNFSPKWRERVDAMARFVPPNAVVIDLGCGERWLGRRSDLASYYPVDFVSRSPDTLVCDFNQGEFPEVRGTVSFLSGAFEYVADADAFVSKVAACAPRCIVSYNTFE